MSVNTLEELKAENAAIEAAENESAPQADESEVVEDVAATEAEEEPEDLAETEGEPEAESEVEGWMQSEADNSQDDNAVPVAAHIKMRSKLKGKIQDRDTEIEDLKAQLAAKPQAQPVTAPTVRPKRDDFFEADEPDDAYDDAMFAWRNNQQASTKAINDQQAQQQTVIANINTSVDEHYNRAATLAADNNIKPEVYQQSDAVVRNAIGEDITNALIANMGAGSEKVMFNLGRNPVKLAELQKAMADDPNGLKAMMLLGKMSADLMPKKRKTMAPRPATNIKGDASPNSSHKALKKKYDAAHKAGNQQEAYDVKKQAKQAGASTREW